MDKTAMMERKEKVCRKTYLAPGFTEWTVELQWGGNRVRVHFTGGRETAHGVAPASYRTALLGEQLVIEHSHQFLQGMIVVAPEHEMRVVPVRRALTAGEQRRLCDNLVRYHGVEAGRLLNRSDGESVAEAMGLNIADILAEGDTPPGGVRKDCDVKKAIPGPKHSNP